MQDQLNFDDIFDVWVPAWWERPEIIAAIALGLLVIAGVLYYVKSFYRKQAQVLDPKARALKKLDTLKPATLFETQETYKEFYVELMNILKEYCDARYNLMCASKTDLEIVAYVQKQPSIAHYDVIFQRLVDHGSPIKFARTESTQEQVTQDYRVVHQLFL